MQKKHLTLIQPDQKDLDQPEAPPALLRGPILNPRENLADHDQNASRKNRNSELLQRMKDGDSLIAFDNHSSWFPPRPKIKKDNEEVKRLYSRVDQENPSDKKS